MKYRRRAAPRAPVRPPPPPPVSGGIDLHLHSSLSDGADTPAELVRAAREAGLAAISLTDHDSVSGIAAAREESRALGLTFVAGIELSVGLGVDEVHILGYGIDANLRSLRNALDMLAGERVERMERMIAALRGLGAEVSLDEVRAEAGGDILGRLHLAALLVRKGLAPDPGTVFQRWIGAGRPAYVRRRILTLREALDLIREAGGVAVMAHPGLTRRDDLIEYLVRLGIRGLEVYYPKHDFVDVSRYEKLCRKYDILALGGSDYHGSAKPDVRIGEALTPAREFEKLSRYIHL